MRITEIEAYQIFIPYRAFNAEVLVRYHGRGIQGRTILVVRADNGLEGYGESWGLMEAGSLCDKYLGTDPFDWLNAEADLPMNMALYDLMGKHLGVPAWKLMGPKVRCWVPVAAWTVSQPPEGMAEEVRQAARLGYHWLKYHVDELQNTVDQTEAMQKAAPRGFKVHYDFNANTDVYTMLALLAELERFPVAGRFEDLLPVSDEEGYRQLRAKCRLPVIIHHGPPAVMAKGLCDGYMAGHAPVGMAMKAAAIAEAANVPIMYQQCGGTINQAFLAHEVAVFRKATLDHVNLCHLWEDDVTVERMEVVGGAVALPEGPGLGVSLDREKLERYRAMAPADPGRFLVRMRYAEGLTVYARHDPNQPGHADALRFLARLHHHRAPGHVPAYNNPINADFLDERNTPDFARLWRETQAGPLWSKET
jgi:L-alanine-DL-glutamate epimerase-like enolase superfamily enzyme